MREKIHITADGSVHYWVSGTPRADAPWLMFVLGLTAGHTLFHPQLVYFEGRVNCLTWDAPAHAASRLYPLNVRANRPYRVDCPALALCGDHGVAGFTKRYNKMWHERGGMPLEWIPNAGHNATLDAPDFVNACIEEFVAALSVARP